MHASLRSNPGSKSKNSRCPKAVLRSLHDIDGDFELQAPAAGGSNGVLVPPWLYEGAIAVTNEAQSPYRNLYPLGKVGVHVPERCRRVSNLPGNLTRSVRTTIASYFM